ncbi:MAG TPA: GWxTD domain-containing protein [Rubricoccaceae bacterium]|nr:GWxTD domain-containing protein [Rubricoccaceae bacterium]
MIPSRAPFRRRALLLAAGFFLWAGAAAAQPDVAEARIQEGIEAYRDGRFEEARRSFEAAVAADETSAEAHFLLARIYFDTPLRDERLAGREIRRARDLAPDNLTYMVAELQQLRTDTWNFFQEMERFRRRVLLARRILSLDSTNAFAHEELGAAFIRDFWAYRNAVAFPNVGFDDRPELRVDRKEFPEASTEPGGEPPEPDPQTVEDIAVAPPDFLAADDLPASVDRFDLLNLRSQAIAVQDLSTRADHAYARAIGHLEASLRFDPRRRSVYDHLMRLYALADRYDEATAMLTGMYVHFPEDVQTWLYLGLANHRLGQEEAADKSFDEALQRMAPEQRAAFEDLAPLLAPDDLARYGEDPEAFARRFWNGQNPRFLTPWNERRLEHYARLTYADLLYRSDDLGLPGWATERGQVFVRYGPPRSDVFIRGDFSEVLNTSGGRLREFASRTVAEQGNVFNVWDYGDLKFVFEDPQQNGEFRLYSPPADLFAVNGIGDVSQMDYVLRAEEMFRETPQRYDFEAPGREVPLPYLVVPFKGEDGRADVYVNYGIPLADDVALTGEVVDLTVKTGAFLITEDHDVLAERRRTLYGLRTDQVRRFAEVKLWTDTQPMAADPGRHTVSVEFETAGGGAAGVQRREVEIPDYATDRLTLSGLLLAYGVEETDREAGPGEVVRNGLAIQPAPWSVYDHAAPVYVYFEVYNLALRDGRTDYHVEARLVPKDLSTGVARLARRVFSGRDRGVATEFPVQGVSPDDGQYVILDASGQAPGLYTLTLRIRDNVAGTTVEQTQDLFLE